MWLHCCTGSMWTILKRKRYNLNWFLLLFSVFQINVKMLMNHMEVGNGISNFWLECTLIGVCSSLALSSHSLHFASGFFFSFEHFLHAIRKVILTVFVDDFLKNSFPSFILFFLNSFKKIDFTIPGQWFSNEFILFFWLFIN